MYLKFATVLLVATLRVGLGGSAVPWSFAPLELDSLPSVDDATWPQTRSDYFILERLEARDLEPSSPASDRELLRRVYFGLIGLPPTAEQVATFRRKEFPRVVEELLASPHYGERWGRHWLDLARYTDKTSGWLKSTASPWLYRDWVVQAFNDDVPYNLFVKRQLANDLIEGHDPKDNAALGFLGLSPTYWKELQLPPEVIKTTVADEWEERVDVVGRTFLGLTVACARCHDHKTDPISQADYYAMAGVFASVRIADRPQMNEKLWAPVAAARTEVEALEKKIAESKKAKQEDAVDDLTRQIESIKKRTPHYDVSMVSGVTEAALFVNAAKERHGTTLDYKEGEARDLKIHKRGDPNQTGEKVARRFLDVFPSDGGKTRLFSRGSGRLDLAEAIVEDAAPLTARVIVNRIWAHHFGRGLAPTPSELGHSGKEPTHPALLTDLAARFVANGWSIKWLHREILLSATWQQGGGSPKAKEMDPLNELISRMERRRVDVEVWRDSMLQVTGELDRTIGGVPMELDDEANHRRTLYGLIHRRDLNKMLRVHDFPDPTAHAPERARTVTPLQQLFALNGSFVRERAAVLAKETATTDGTNRTRVEKVYQRLFQRAPRSTEFELAEGFLGDGEDTQESWTQYLHALLVSNEFLFVE